MATTQQGGSGMQHGQPSRPPAPGDPLAAPGTPPGMQPPGGFPAPAAAPPGHDLRYAPPPPRRGKGMAVAVAAAIVLATAALVLGIVDLTRSSTPAPRASTPTSPAPTTAPADFTAANRALCTAIAPLMTESNRVSKTLSSLAPAGSPAWNAGLPNFVRDTKDWLGRIQPVIDSHTNVDPYFQRSLQRFVDDRRFLVADLEAGPWQPYDQTNWDDSLSALNGPLTTCWDLGVKW